MDLTLQRLDKVKDYIQNYIFDNNYIVQNVDAWICDGKDKDVFFGNFSYNDKNIPENSAQNGTLYVIFETNSLDCQEVYAANSNGLLMGKEILEKKLDENFDIFNPKV